MRTDRATAVRRRALTVLVLCLATSGLVAAAAPVALDGRRPVGQALQADGAPVALPTLGFGPATASGGPFQFDPGMAVMVDAKAAVTVAVNARATSVHVLHTLVPGQPVADWKTANQAARTAGDPLPDRLTVLEYVVLYADGRSVPLNVRYGKGIGAWLRDWWNPVDGFVYDLPFAPVAWQAKLGPGGLRSAVVYALSWPNPRPDTPIVSVTLKAGAGLGKGKALVYAVTTEDTPLTGATYTVAPAGDDAGPGSFDQPWATLQKAAATVKAGDTVYVRGGTYRPTRRIAFRDLKAPEGRRTSIIGYPGETATFDFMDALWDESPDREQLGFEVYPHDQSMIHAYRCEHFTFKNLHLMQSRARGIGSEQGVDNELCYNFVYKTFGPGIRFGDQLRGRCIGNTLVRPTSMTMDPGDQPPMEALDSSELSDCVIAYNEICWADKESMLIDGNANGLRIHHNYVHDGWNFPCVTGISPNGYGKQENIEIDHNIAHTLGFGFGVGTEGGGSGSHVRIHHNIAWDCHWAGAGITGAWSADADLNDISIYNNTFVHNGYVDWNTARGRHTGFLPGRERPWTQGTVRKINGVVQDVLVANNLIIQPRDYVLVLEHNGDAAASRIVFTNNLTDAWVETNRVTGDWHAVRGEHLIIADPLLTDVQARDFRLRAGSPAIGAGVAIKDGRLDPGGAPVNIGAFPFDAP